MMGQTADLAPADKKIYALRDVTATVECIPLIVSSILSKKLSESLDGLVLDVKYGNGAFMPTFEEAKRLATNLREGAERQGVKTVALLTRMDEPLGTKVGHWLEVEECADYLTGEAREAGLQEVVLALASMMVTLASRGKLTVAAATEECLQELESKRPFEYFKKMFAVQGGDWERAVTQRETLRRDLHVVEYRAPQRGTLMRIEASACGVIIGNLGGARATREDKIDPLVGMEFLKKVGDSVEKDEKIVRIFHRAGMQSRGNRTGDEGGHRYRNNDGIETSVGHGGTGMTIGLWEQLEEARAMLLRRVPNFPKIGVVLGSGLSGILESLKIEAEIPYSEIPHMKNVSVVGHKGSLVVGSLDGVRLACMRGRLHFYEGFSMSEVVFPLRALARCGADIFILTNAAGGVHGDMKPMDLMLVKDHINLMGTNPLVGPNDSRLGERFPDMTQLYDPELREIILGVAETEGIALRQGVYLAIHGPSYETPSEVRSYRAMGCDVVGMSTVPEAIALRHMGKRVVGISCITNLASGVGGATLDHSEVLQAGAKVTERFQRLLTGTLKKFQQAGMVR